MIEALVLSVMGCLIGVLFSWFIIGIISLVAGNVVATGNTLTFHVSPSVAGIAVAFSIAIGVLFGIYPANQAAKKNPIEALRYEG